MRRLVLPVALALALAATMPFAAQGQTLMTEEAARAMLEETYGVEVLRIAVDRDSVDIFVVRVMNPGGDFNEAFQVNVLVVDRRTGMLVPQFRHTPSGVRDTAGARRDAAEGSGPVLRRKSLR